jgi:hypothetical protein
MMLSETVPLAHKAARYRCEIAATYRCDLQRDARRVRAVSGRSRKGALPDADVVAETFLT